MGAEEFLAKHINFITVPTVVERNSKGLGFKTTGLLNAAYKLLRALKEDDLEKVGVIRRGNRYLVFDEAKFIAWLKKDGGGPSAKTRRLGPAFGVQEIPSHWDIQLFLKNATGRYMLRAFSKRYGGILNANYDQLGGASRFSEEDRNRMGIFRTESGYWAIEAKPFIQSLEERGFLKILDLY